MPDPLRIGFVTIHAAADRLSYLGTAFAMRESLRLQDVALTNIDGLSTLLYPLWRAKQARYWFGLKKRYWMKRQPAVVAAYGRQVAASVASAGPIDVLFSPGRIPLTRFTAPIPTAFSSDATFHCLADFYPEACDFSLETIANGHRLGQEALASCSLAIYFSRQAQLPAEITFPTPPSKLEACSYGANVDPAAGPLRRGCRRRPAARMTA